ncbi:ferric-dicitrate binding protein FerR (iron transport regulator) [Pedobacter cryoconitis]|uniref:Ferric-dicitrate binding protein FerR (Iron transport regulator) n=1 Tax=Pedobacter cryoconitis TaxID=188932 RepID=A0A7W8ZQS5_9SPHI|nr:FecR family protein [Pedobacter cryoconitis]MBB5638177.1 ferric-dicitrate binding protein FerR (iron transport regulator) [Pedobacter cryoconitis]
MKRSRIIELLARKMAGEATQRELEELTELINSFPDAVYYDEVLQQIWLNSDEGPDSCPDIDRIYQCHKLKFYDELVTPEQENPVPVLSQYKKLSGALLALCILFFIGIFYLGHKDNEVFNTQIIAGKGVRKNVKLPDGTVVWLNADSKLSYNTAINHKDVRVVHLTGEAFFDVAHRQSHPFIVRTDKISIKVLGTAFNVKAYPVDEKSVATLLRGSIELSVNKNSSQKIILNPLEKFVLDDDKQGVMKMDEQDMSLMIEHIVPVRIGNYEYIEEVSWKNNTLVFHNETFEDLKPRMERWFNIRVHLNSEKAKSYRFTGVFKNENIKEALTAMQLIKPFTFNLKAHDVIIY